jgi:uncharacterized protein (UPF0297 family)
MKDNLTETLKMERYERENRTEVKEIMRKVYHALQEKGYSPITQIVGYILSGDPTYITSHRNARAIIGKMERDELLEELVRDYLSESP